MGLQWLAEKALGSMAYPCAFHKDVEHIPVLVDTARQVSTFTLNRHGHLIEKPTVTTRAAPFPETPRVVESELWQECMCRSRSADKYRESVLNEILSFHF